MTMGKSGLSVSLLLDDMMEASLKSDLAKILTAVAAPAVHFDLVQLMLDWRGSGTHSHSQREQELQS